MLQIARSPSQQDVLSGSAAVLKVVFRVPAYNNDTYPAVSNEFPEVGGFGNPT
jgi:hypothetical protein